MNPDVTPLDATRDDEPLLRVAAVHAMLYCERLFYLEEVEEIRRADAAVFAGRTLHEEIARDEDGTVETFTLESSALGLRGRLDALRRRDGQWIPYEHKKGRAQRDRVKRATPWPSDRMQVVAYALLLEEATGQSIAEGRLRYHTDNVTVRVPIDAAARAELCDVVERARALRRTVERPPVTTNERLCGRCSLAPVCLPEEERLARDPDWEPVRLAPPDDDRLALHVVGYGSRVGRSGDEIVVTPREGAATKLPVHEVGHVVVHGGSQVSSQVLALCVEKDVAVSWVTGGGRYLGTVGAGAASVQRRVRQYKALTDETMRRELARRLTMGKVEGQLRFLLRSTRGGRVVERDEVAEPSDEIAETADAREVDAVDAQTPRAAPKRSEAVEAAIRAMRSALRGVHGAQDTATMMGHEGDAAASYFGAWNALLVPTLDERLRYVGRTRRPPRDRVSALLGFGYALLLKDVTAALLAVGLEPALGFYHQPRSAAPPLALDLMELFRVPLVDMPVIASLNRGQWDPDADFAVTGPRVWLSDDGRKKFIDVYERRTQERWKHSVVGYSLSYGRMIELEARLLEKEWTDTPGLFARFRLR